MNKARICDYALSDSTTKTPDWEESERSTFGCGSFRYFTERRWWGVLLIFCAFAIVGCRAFIEPESEGLLLNADFEGYEEGAPVGLIGLAEGPQAGAEIPGLPAGDRIIPKGTSCSGSTYTVSSNDPLSGQKSLRLQYARLPHCDESCGICEDRVIIDFVPLSPKDNDVPILLFWNGRLSNTLDDTMMEVSVSEVNEFFSIIRLVIRPDRMEVNVGMTLEKVVIHDFGSAHSIFVRVSPDAGTFGVQVSGPGLVTPPNNLNPCTFPQVACGEFSANNFDPTALVLRMQFSGTPPSVSVTTPPVYVVDNVKIIQE